MARKCYLPDQFVRIPSFISCCTWERRPRLGQRLLACDLGLCRFPLFVKVRKVCLARNNPLRDEGLQTPSRIRFPKKTWPNSQVSPCKTESACLPQITHQ